MQEMQDIERGRSTARTDDDLILFLIGMCVNRAWRLDKWWWVYRSMKRMVRYLKTHPEAGLIHSQRWRARTTMQVSYWRSFDHLLAFAADDTAPPRPGLAQIRQAGDGIRRGGHLPRDVRRPPRRERVGLCQHADFRAGQRGSPCQRRPGVVQCAQADGGAGLGGVFFFLRGHTRSYIQGHTGLRASRNACGVSSAMAS